MKAKDFLLLLAVVLFILAMGQAAFLGADHPVQGTGMMFKSSGAGSVADPAIPHVILSGSGAINGTVNLAAGTTLTANLAASENYIGTVGGPGVVLTLTPTLDTTTYADGETLFSTAAIGAVTRTSGGRGYVQTITVLDEDDQGIALDVLFLNASTTIGVTNGAVAVTDTNARNIIGRVSVGASDFYDMGGSRIATINTNGLMLQSSGTTSVWAAGVSRGAGTYSASGLKIQFGIMQD